MAKLVRKGAEADIYLGEWIGNPAIIKVRKEKPYRYPQLDLLLRQRRTVREAQFLSLAREAGVTTPLVFFLDPEGAEITMQFIEGTRFKELLQLSGELPYNPIKELGDRVAKLHKVHIIHGDLTTSNFILTSDNQVAILDFGLSFFSSRVEDMAVDLHLLKEVLTSIHYYVAEDTLKTFLEAYGKVAGRNLLNTILSKVREIERRGRYARVV